MKTTSILALTLASTALCAGLAVPAASRDGAASDPAAGRDDAPPVIIVTAQRREENLQDVPIAATALSGERLNDKAVERLADLQFAAPSVSITDQGLTQSGNLSPTTRRR